MASAGSSPARSSSAFTIVIPARHASTRLPAKALADLGGKPMIVRVAERVAHCGAARVVVATDHADIAKVAQSHGVHVLMTRADHPSGTDRIAEVVEQLGLDDGQVVVNVQGDEPLIPPRLVSDVAQALIAREDAAIATACHDLQDPREVFNPNVVKVVCDHRGDALYFSRAPIPYARDWYGVDEGGALFAPSALPADLPVLRHIGLYAYRAGFLRAYGRLAPAPLERFEALEQLRALWHGYRIAVVRGETIPEAGVDTPADLERMQRRFRRESDSPGF